MNTINPNISTAQAIKEFYDKNGFGDDGGVSQKYAWIKFGFISIPIPNTESRKTNVYLHDLNHIITDNDTTWRGESAVSAWEVASGGWQNQYFLWLLTLWAMGLGVVFYPVNIFKSFKAGLKMKNALTSGLSKNQILELSVSDLKLLVSNKPDSKKNPYVWMLISSVVFLTPFVIGLVSIAIFLI